jgi:ketosteroid isomerase-like protein
MNDEAAIREILANWGRAFETLDTQLAVQDYAMDADWISAYGVVARGLDQIRKYLSKLFSPPGGAGTRRIAETATIRFVRPDSRSFPRSQNRRASRARVERCTRTEGLTACARTHQRGRQIVHRQPLNYE